MKSLALLLAASAFFVGACERGIRRAPVPSTGADLKRHYGSLSPAGEVIDTTGVVNIYAATGPDSISSVAERALPMVYVPNSKSASVSEIDPKTYEVIKTFHTGEIPQHVVPSYDLTQLWVLNNQESTVTPIDPLTGEAGKKIPVDDPYNMYFSPNGQYAIVVAEARKRLDFRDPHTMGLIEKVQTDCKGIDHMDFTPDGHYAIATCEFDGKLLKFDLETHTPVAYLQLDTTIGDGGAMPQDSRSTSDGKLFLIADMMADGVRLIDPVEFKEVGFIKTGTGTHGIYPTRDGKRFYVTNRGWRTLNAGKHGPGSISVVDPSTRSVVANWPVPGGGSPDMGNVSADGKELWVSGRYDSEVYVFDTETGELKHRIPVGKEPHGLTVWPQPGRYSLGHTGNMR